MTGHPDPDVLAEFREGLLGRRRTRRIRAHLAGCARCAAVDHEIAEVSSLLASAPAPRIPDELISRLQAALTAESAARAAQASPQAQPAAEPAPGREQAGSLAPVHLNGPDQPGEAARPDQVDRTGRGSPAPGLVPVHPDGRDQAAGLSPETARPDETGEASRPGGPGQAGRASGPGRGARRRAAPLRSPALRAAAIAAAVVVVAGGGYGLARVLSGSSGPGVVAGSPRFSSGLGAHRPGAPDATPNPKPASGTLPGASVAALPLIRSGTDYQPGQLAAQVEQVVRRHEPSMATSGNSSLLQREPRGLAGCVSAITGGTRPRLVDQARYRGRPATIIVTAGAGGRPGQVWVAGSGCSATSPDVITHAQLTGAG